MYMKFIISESQLSRLISEEMKFLFSNAFVRYEGLNEWIVNLKFDYIDDETEKIFSYDFELHISKDAFNEQNKPIEHCIWKLEMFEPDRVTFDYLDTTDEDTMNNIRSRVKWLFNQGDVKETVLKAIGTTKIHENKILKEDKLFLFAKAKARDEHREYIVNLEIDTVDNDTDEIFTYKYKLYIDKERYRRATFSFVTPQSDTWFEDTIWKIDDLRTHQQIDYFEQSKFINWLFSMGNVYDVVKKSLHPKNMGNINEKYGNYTKKDILILMENEGEIEKDKKGFWDYRLDLHDLTETYFEFNLKLGNDIENGDYIEYNIGGEITNEDSPYGEDWWIDVISQLYPEYKEINSDDIMWDYIVEVFESDMENILSNASESGKVIQKGGNAFRR
jgi:hypothetical protein